MIVLIIIKQAILFDSEFGDFHNKAVDETWYKTAILQHQIDPKSFVFSVPHANDPKEPGELKITATHAIFPRDGGKDAPSSVVGFQFSHANMYKRFMEITNSGGVSDLFKIKCIYLFNIFIVRRMPKALQ